jgi:hypothetical protein
LCDLRCEIYRMSILVSIALAALHLHTSSFDSAGILAAALNRLMPARPTSAFAPTGRARLANRKLFLDVSRTTEAFRALGPLVSPDYAKIGRPFVARERAEAIHCSRGRGCAVDDDGVYAAITAVKTDKAVNSYRIVLLLLFNGSLPPQRWVTGTETEMFISLDKRGEWTVDRIGKIAALN